jgi:hypothetical protein
MTRGVASPKFRVLLAALLVSSLIIFDCRTPFDGPAKEPCQNLKGKHDDEFERR